jgi:putative endonuclease
MNIGALGKKGEDMVASFLVKRGHTILKRNYLCRFGEIDIIAKKENVLLFVEVKTRKENSLVSPKEAVDSRKIARIIKAGQDYLSKSIEEAELQPRFDVAEVILKNDGKFHLDYIKNAF